MLRSARSAHAVKLPAAHVLAKLSGSGVGRSDAPHTQPKAAPAALAHRALSFLNRTEHVSCGPLHEGRGIGVGALVGLGVGALVGLGVGALVGLGVGTLVGLGVGAGVGASAALGDADPTSASTPASSASAVTSPATSMPGSATTKDVRCGVVKAQEQPHDVPLRQPPYTSFASLTLALRSCDDIGRRRASTFLHLVALVCAADSPIHRSNSMPMSPSMVTSRSGTMVMGVDMRSSLPKEPSCASASATGLMANCTASSSAPAATTTPLGMRMAPIARLPVRPSPLSAATRTATVPFSGSTATAMGLTSTASGFTPPPPQISAHSATRRSAVSPVDSSSTSWRSSRPLPFLFQPQNCSPSAVQRQSFLSARHSLGLEAHASCPTGQPSSCTVLRHSLALVAHVTPSPHGTSPATLQSEEASAHLSARLAHEPSAQRTLPTLHARVRGQRSCLLMHETPHQRIPLPLHACLAPALPQSLRDATHVPRLLCSTFSASSGHKNGFSSSAHALRSCSAWPAALMAASTTTRSSVLRASNACVENWHEYPKKPVVQSHCGRPVRVEIEHLPCSAPPHTAPALSVGHGALEHASPLKPKRHAHLPSLPQRPRPLQMTSSASFGQGFSQASPEKP